MDPVSLAFGVVSVALQLVETTSAIQKLIATYKSAAKELAALSDKLDNIETICHSLEAVLANSEDLPRPWEVTLLKKLHKVIGDCRDRVSRVHDIISKILSRHHERRKPLNSLGALFLRHGSQIRQCNDDLDQSLSSLQLHMTTNILAVSMRPPAFPPQKSICSATTIIEDNSQVANRTASSQSRRMPLIQSHPEESVQHSKCGWNTVAYLKTTLKRKQLVGFGGPGCPATQDDLTIRAAVPLISLYVKMSIRRGYLSPLSITIQFPHMIKVGPAPDEIGRRVYVATYKNDLDTVKFLFSQGVLTPTTTATWGSAGAADDTMSLIGLATVQSAYNIFQFLAHHFPEVSQRSKMNHLGYDHASILHNKPDIRCALSYINLRKQFLTPIELWKLLGGIYDVGRARACIDLCWTHSHKDWAQFNLCVWEWVAVIFLDWSGPCMPASLTEDLIPILTEACSRGLDIHDMALPALEPPNCQQRVLERILKHADTEETALATMHSWVDLLEQAGIDVQQYLAVEVQYIGPRWDKTMCGFHGSTSFQRSFVVRNSRGRRLPSFIQTIDISCPVREVFNEFPHLVHVNFYGHVRGPLGVLKPHWIRPNIMVESYVETEDFPSWPVYPPFDQHLKEQCMRYGETKKQKELLDRSCDLMESRLDRKQLKKMRKAGLRMARQMPGAWVD
ncbi:hypothetical protein ACJZ2D_002068 [Fusarium nematophilum]